MKKKKPLEKSIKLDPTTIRITTLDEAAGGRYPQDREPSMTPSCTCRCPPG